MRVCATSSATESDLGVEPDDIDDKEAAEADAAEAAEAADGVEGFSGEASGTTWTSLGERA